MIWDLLARVTTVIADNPWLAIGVAFLAAVIEAVAVVGMLLPGTAILMAVAGAAALAGLPMAPILVAAVLGAVLGDGVSFWLGRRYNNAIRRVWPFSTRPGLMQSAEQFFQRYGAMSVALCRFVPVLRSTVPLVAGMAGMAKSRFLIANIGSALVWAPTHVYPAQFAGLSIESLEAGDGRAAALWGGAVLAAAIFLFALHRLGPHGLKLARLFIGRSATVSENPPALDK